jgi:hypothetical protein
VWQLCVTNAAKEWIEVGRFDTVTAAARCIRQMEGRPTGGIFLEIHVYTESGDDDEAFSVLHYTGRQALYGIRRRVN